MGPRGASRIGGGWVKIHVFFEGVREGTAFQVRVVEESFRLADADHVPRLPPRTPDEARRHEALKNELAEEHSDGDAYAKAKTSYVWEVVRRAESQRELLIQVHK